MGIQINGQTDTISATDGGLVVSGAELPTVSNLNATGISTFNSGIRVIGVGSSVGIGTNNPAEQLELSAGSERLMIGANSPSTYSRIAARNVTNTGYRGFQIDGSDLLINSNTSGNVLLGNGGGNIGVGTDNPADSSKLHVQGGGGLLVRRSAGTSIARFGNTANASPNITVFGSSTTNEPYIGCSTNDLTFGTSNTERSRIDSSGRLLVGTTSSDWTRPRVVIVGNPNETTTGAGVLYLQKANGTVVAGDKIGEIAFSTSSSNVGVYAEIICEGDATGGSADFPGRLVFKTCTDGGSSTVERMRLASNGDLTCPGVYSNTTAAAANVVVSTSPYYILRSTSSIKYKTNVEDIDPAYSAKLLDCRPVWFRSTCSIDNPNWSHWGFIAEEVASIDPRLVHWKTKDRITQEDGTQVEIELETPEPEGVQYDRFVPHLLNLIKRQQQAIEDLQAEVAALKAK